MVNVLNMAVTSFCFISLIGCNSGRSGGGSPETAFQRKTSMEVDTAKMRVSGSVNKGLTMQKSAMFFCSLTDKYLIAFVRSESGEGFHLAIPRSEVSAGGHLKVLDFAKGPIIAFDLNETKDVTWDTTGCELSYAFAVTKIYKGFFDMALMFSKAQEFGKPEAQRKAISVRAELACNVDIYSPVESAGRGD